MKKGEISLRFRTEGISVHCPKHEVKPDEKEEMKGEIKSRCGKANRSETVKRD